MHQNLKKWKNKEIINQIKYFDIKEVTWRRNNMESQIDDIYITNDMIPSITKPIIRSAERITNSDHKIILVEWQSMREVKQYRSKKRKRTIYLYKEITEEK